jgi:NADPH:quinone reductase-like Zn-dependent oxidoreductase
MPCTGATPNPQPSFSCTPLNTTKPEAFAEVLGTGKDPPRAKQVLNEVMSLLSSGKVVPILYEPVYDGLDDVTQALADLEGRKTWGKAVIRVRRDPGERAKL